MGKTEVFLTTDTLLNGKGRAGMGGEGLACRVGRLFLGSISNLAMRFPIR